MSRMVKADAAWERGKVSRFRTDARVGTAFHRSTARRMTTNWYFNWDLCMVPDEFVNYVDELNAIRTGVAMADMSPLTKCTLTGRDAQRALDYFVTRDVSKMEVGQVCYAPICDHGGKLITDALIFREQEAKYRVTSDPVSDWFAANSSGFDIALEDVTANYGILTLQGPRSRDVLEALTGQEWKSLNFSRLVRTHIADIEVEVGRTGFTGELGYEICVAAHQADDLWNAVEAGGARFGIIPAGEQAIDIARTEAGLMISGCDYGQPDDFLSGSHCKMSRNQDRLLSPYDCGYESFVSLGKDFIGRSALEKEQARGGGRYCLLGLEIDWRGIVTHCADQGIAPFINTKVDWEGSDLYLNDKRCGWASSIVWSPTVRQMIAFGHVERQTGLKIGDRVSVNWHVRGGRDGRIDATLVPLPFVALKRAQS